MYIDEQELEANLLLRDRDTKFTSAFDGIFKAQGIIPKRLPIRSPNLNAYAERFVQTLTPAVPALFTRPRRSCLRQSGTSLGVARERGQRWLARGGIFEQDDVTSFVFHPFDDIDSHLHVYLSAMLFLPCLTVSTQFACIFMMISVVWFYLLGPSLS